MVEKTEEENEEVALGGSVPRSMRAPKKGRGKNRNKNIPIKVDEEATVIHGEQGGLGQKKKQKRKEKNVKSIVEIVPMEESHIREKPKKKKNKLNMETEKLTQSKTTEEENIKRTELPKQKKFKKSSTAFQKDQMLSPLTEDLSETKIEKKNTKSVKSPLKVLEVQNTVAKVGPTKKKNKPKKNDNMSESQPQTTLQPQPHSQHRKKKSL